MSGAHTDGPIPYHTWCMCSKPIPAMMNDRNTVHDVYVGGGDAVTYIKLRKQHVDVVELSSVQRPFNGLNIIAVNRSE